MTAAVRASAMRAGTPPADGRGGRAAGAGQGVRGRARTGRHTRG